MKNISEKILKELSKTSLLETIGYCEPETIDAVTSYYMDVTGASITNEAKAHTTGGGYSHQSYTKVTFDDGTIMIFRDGGSHIELNIYREGEDYYIDFEIWEKDYKEDIDTFINGGKPKGSYLISFKGRNHPLDSTFNLQNAVDNKGNLVMSLEKSGDNKEEMIKMFNELPNDFPVVTCSGLWNSMVDGRLTTKGQVKDLDFSEIYGGKDEFEIYDNLVYIKTVSGSEMF